MPHDNAIELFNCSLCSYCETSLDGLASHIRKHIKPEPVSVTRDTANRGNLNKNNDNPNLHEKTNLVNGIDSSSALNSISYEQNALSTSETITLAPRIEVINPRIVGVNGTHNGTHNGLPNDSQKTQPIVSNYKNSYIPSPQDKIPPASFPRNLAPQQQIRHSIMHQDGRLENIAPQPPPPRYVQLHPREPQYIEINSSHHPFTNQYVANISGKPTLVHTDLVPVVSAKNGIQEIGPRGEIIYRNMPGSDRIPKSIAPAPPMSSPNRMSGNDIRIRPNHPYDGPNNVHHSYPPQRPVVPIDNSYRSNVPPNHSSSGHPLSPHGMKTQRQSHSAAVSPLTSPFNTPTLLSPQNHKAPADDRLKQYHMNRLSGMQLSDIQKHNSTSHGAMNVPNNGALFLNPEQLMLGNVNASILEQLAGLLVIPLKKTREVSCQTDAVSIGGNSSNDKNARGIQTDLLMGQIHENSSQNSPPMFGTFRSTDDLYECIVCGEEFASDYHLQEHMSKFHTHVCEKCYHSSTNIHEHNMHITDCGNRDTEMVCIECNSTFVSLKKLNQHRSKSHNVRMPFRCGVCNVPFETHEAVMKHISTHDNEVPEFKCRYCVKIFQSADGLSKHFSRHKGVDVLHECRFCKKSFSSGKLLNDHISYVHVIRESQDGSEPVFAIGSPGKPDKEKGIEDESAISVAKKYPLCRHCDLAFKNNELLQQHIENCSKNNDAKATPFVCDVCKEYYSSDIQRKQHLKKEHKRDSGFRCPKCSKIYRTWSRLKFHTKQQHLKKICPDCPMIFTKEHVLRKHQEDKHGKPQGQPGDRVYTCSLCHTMLNTLTELMTHRKEVHPELSEMRTADRSSNATMLSYIDNINDDSVTVDKNDDVSRLKTYPIRGMVIKRSPSSEEITQNGDSFKCHTCGLAFEDEKRLKNHKGLIHGEKPFKCKLCSKSFQYSSQVVWHMRSHKPKEKGAKVSSKLWKSKNKKFAPIPKTAVKNRFSFICQFCGAKFSQEKLLKNHKGSVHKIKLFSCDICNYKCGHSTELIWHVRTCRAKFKRKYPDSDYPVKENKAAKIDNEISGNENDGYVCHVCDSAFTIFENYQSHMRSHPGEEIPSHNIDSKEVFDDDGLQDASNDLESDPYSDNSAARLRSPSSSMTNIGAEELLNIEPEYDQSTGEYVCPVCHKTTRSMTGMKTHYGRVHGVWSEGTSHIDKVKPKIVDDSIWPCKSCDRQFSSLGSLRHHTTVIHGFSVNKEDVDVIRAVDMEPSGTPDPIPNEVSYSCPYCDVTFSKSKSIRVHAFKKHGTVLTDAVVNQWRNDNPVKAPTNSINPNCIRFKCYKCKSKFRSTKALRVHSIKRHNLVLSKKELQRTKIRIKLSEALPQPSVQAGHKEATGQVFPCDYCGRVFANHRAYFTHYRQAHRDATGELMSPKKPSKNEIVNYDPNMVPEINHDGLGTPTKKIPLKKEIPPGEKVHCPKCDQAFAQIKGLYTHLYAAHHITKEQYPSLFPDGMPMIPSKQAVCSLCDRVCVDNRAMRIHVFKAHGLLYKDMSKDFDNVEGDIPAVNDITNGESEIPEETFHDNDNELRVVEAELGPPVCFICGRLFKSRRALMTHEYKYHGIRWVGNKRIFPPQVRNVPNLKSISNKNQSNPKMNSGKLGENSDVGGYQNDALYSGYNSLDGNQIGMNPDYREESQLPLPVSSTGAEACPKCTSRFQNRRALTTHLVRIHRWKKIKLHAYFATLTKDKEGAENESNEIELDNDEIDVDNTEDINNGNGENGNIDQVNIAEDEIVKTDDIVKADDKEDSDNEDIIINETIHEGMQNGDIINGDLNNEVINDEIINGDMNEDIDDTSIIASPCEVNEPSDDADMYVTPDTNMFCLNGHNLIDMNGVNHADNMVDINDNEGDCDTIKKSDIEAYEGIGKGEIDLNGDISNSENIDVDDIDNILGAAIFTGKYDMNVNGLPFDQISTNS